MSTRDLALIGAGYWGKNLARNFHALGALHTLSDLSSAILDTYGVDYAGVRKTQVIDEVWTDPAITRVAIAAPAVLHYRLAKTALLAGKDVFVEKPLCLDLSEAHELIELARVHGRILMVGHLLQYHPLMQHLQSLVAEGELGPLHYITSNRLNFGKIRREENALWSFAPHDLSVILSLAGAALPTSVRCTGGAYLTPGVADTTLTSLTFPQGLRAQVYVSWLNPFKEQKLTVVGARGMAVFDDTRPWAEKLVIYRDYLRRAGTSVPAPNKLVPEYVVVPEAEPLRAECAHFLECCRDRRAPRTNGAEGERVLRVLHAAQSSLERDGEAETLSKS
jgi:UDP-2-acetamido-3-amino-2,3-dideoxy-glucuronate N-acetyltransferase